MIRFKKKMLCIAAVVFAVFIALGVFLGVYVNRGINASATTTVGNRVTPLDLMNVHKVDYVMGPLATKATTGANTGKYVDAAGNVLLDKDENETNNVYGIPRTQYYNIESYIHTDDTVENGVVTKRVLRGFKKGISAVYRVNASAAVSTPIDEDGKVNGTVSIYFDNANLSSENKYMLIMPDSITSIGTGSGAFFCSGDTCREGGTCLGHQNGGRKLTASDIDYKFTDFANFIFDGAWPNGYFSPRERVAGIYFNSSSKLMSIDGGLKTENSRDGSYGNSWTRNNTKGKSAIAALDNMKFCVLPNNGKLTRIGDYAFYYDTQLRDFNLPGSVSSLGKSAFTYCSSLVHLSVPGSATTLANNAGDAIESNQVFTSMTKLAEVENNSSAFSNDNFITDSGTSALFNIYSSSSGGSSLLVVGNSASDTGANGYYFCKNIRDTQGTLATTTKPSAVTYQYQKNQWYAIALAGKEDTSGDLVHVFPDEVSDSSERRNNIQYDFLNSDGKKCKNSLGTEKITSYDIGNSFSSSTWCTGAVLPACVNIIGDDAFNYSHLQYLEVHAAVIGYHAFYNNQDVHNAQEQYYYIHNEMTTYGSYPFAVNTENKGIIRNYIFGDYDVYKAHVQTTGDSVGSLKTGSIWQYNTARLDSKQFWQIPVYANVYSEDGDVNISSYTDLSDRFFYDNDYPNRKSAPAGTNENGNYKILLTKRLSGNSFNVTKQANGSWADDTANKPFKEPIIEGMTKTQWYKEAAYTTANKIESVTKVYSNSSQKGINVYTKKVAQPPVNMQDWWFVEAMENAANKGEYSFNKLLDLSDDYVVSCDSHVTPWGGMLAEKPTYVSAAGTYQLTIQLDSAKWGEWAETVPATATVAQMEIDLGRLANIPVFYARSSSSNLIKLADDTIYEHIDGWDMVSTGSLGSVQVVNSYVGYTGTNLSLTPMTADRTAWSLYTIEGNSSSSLNGLNSDRYSATYKFTVKNANYKFVYTGTQEGFNERRMGFTSGSMLERSAEFSKQWYITKSANWLIIKDSSDTTPYKPVIKTDGSGEEINLWEYEFVGYQVNVPALAHGTAQLKATITLDGKSLASNIVVEDNTLGYYINPAMPAGEYEVLIAAEAVTVDSRLYPAFNTCYTITVTDKPLEVSAITEYLTGSKAETTGNVFEDAYKNGALFLYTEGEDWQNIKNTINASLNTKRNAAKQAGADNYWAKSASDGYYGETLLKYNLDTLRTTAYYTAEELDGFSAAPKAAGQYLVYYSISAPNYITVGEVDKGSDARRNYRFTTVIYDMLSASGLAAVINSGNYVYSGSRVEATVPYSVDYSYSFDDTTPNAYITVDRKHYVTVTINNPLLMRWKDTTDVNIVDFDADNQIVTIAYSISADTNSWQSAPQMTAWSYKGFAAGTHKIAATLTYQGAEVYYRLGRLVDGEYEWVVVGKELVNGNYYFTVSDGEVTDGDVIASLNGLSAGYYYLDSYVAAKDVNVKGFTTSTQSTVYIAPAVNLWTSSPNVIRWTWGGFDESVNLFSATAQFGAADLSEYELKNDIAAPQVQYTILKIANGKFVPADDALINFASVDATVAVALEGLDAGTYYLVATLAERDNFRAINSAAIGDSVDYNDSAVQKVQFDIRVAYNTWTTSPRMISWQYQQFTAASNFVAGIPTYGTTVTYGIYTSEPADGIKPTGTTAFTAIGDVADSLTDLGVGDYWLVAYVDGVDNQYAPLYRTINFAVRQATNSWSDNPAISGWMYDNFEEELVTAGDAAYGDLVYTVRKATATGAIGDVVAGYDKLDFSALYTKLANLSVNVIGGNVCGYYLIVTTTENDNYQAVAEKTLPFTITRAANSWKTNPSIDDSWEFADSPSSAPSNGELNFKETGVSVETKYYVAARNTSGQLVVDYNQPLKYQDENGVEQDVDDNHLPVNVGTYARVTKASAGTNYDAVDHVSFFTITKISNSLKAQPEISLDWIWGEADKTLTADKVILKAEATHPATVYYTLFNTDTSTYVGGETISCKDILETLKKLPVGQYIVRTVIEESPNYGSPEAAQTVITVSAANFNVTTNPSSAGWTWGATSKLFTAMVVGKVVSSDLTLVDINSEIEYSVNDGAWTNYATMLASLQGSPAGTYSVNVRFKYDNYNDYMIATPVSVVIGEASFTWNINNPSKCTWAWNNSTLATGKTLHDLKASTTANGVTDVTVTYVVRKGGTSTDPFTYEELCNYLYGTDKIDTYTVIATASAGSANDANFTSASKTRTFEVEITKAQNSWTTTPTTSIVFEFNENGNWMTKDKITLGVPKYGTVKYYGNDNVLITDEDVAQKLVDLINDLNASTTAYSFNIVVEGDRDNRYEGITETLSVTVKGIASAWANESDIELSYTFTYGSDLSEKMGTVVIPYLETIPSSASSSATLEYLITYVNYKNERVTTTFRMGYNDVTLANIVGLVEAYLQDTSRHAGVYTVNAVYDPHTDNYAELNTTVTITVNRLTVDWTEETKKLKDEYIFERGNAAGITPVTNAFAVAGITVPVKYVVDDVEIEANDLTAYVNSLPIGSYIIKYSVTETDNYTRLAAVTMRVVITKAANRWVDIERKTVWEFHRGETISIKIPKALHGSNTYTLNGSDIETSDFNAFLNSNASAAGNYEITIRVKETDEYYGTEAYSFTLRILLNDNSWDRAPLGSINKVGSLLESDFIIPLAHEANSLLRFDIEKAGGGTQYGLNVIDFKGAIPSLTDGTYTITMRVGGKGPGYTEDDADALNTYNADYNPLIATTVVTVTRAQISFTTALAVADWAYDQRLTAPDGVTRPVFDVIGVAADEKNDFKKGIEARYSIIGGKEDVKDVTYAEFRLALQGLDPGTYSATASIETTTRYIGASSTVAFTVSKITTQWANPGDLKNFYTWTYGAYTGELKTPKLSATDKREVKYTLRSGANTTENIAGTEWADKLATLGAGTYIFTATVDANDYYTAAEYSTTVTVLRATREWRKQPAQTSITWTYGNTGNTPIEYAYDVPANDEADASGKKIASLKIYVDGDLVSSLQTALTSLGYGTHTIRATVDQTAYYEELTQTVNLTVNRAANAWYADNERTYSMSINTEWAWDNVVNDTTLAVLRWQTPIPKYGTTENITVDRYTLDASGNKVGTSTVFVTTFTYANHSLVGDDSGLKMRLRALDAGEYRITAQIPQDDYYLALSQTINFTVTKADNSWKQGSPSVDTSSGVVSIQFFPKYGNYNDVIVSYAPEGTTDWSTQVPIAKGNYIYKAYLAGSDNYNELHYTGGSFSLKKENNGWVVVPGVSGWEWNAFDKTVNIFRGTAISNGTVTFKIEYSETEVRGLLTSDFSGDFTFDQDDIDRVLNGGFNREGNGLVSDEVAEMLKWLKPKDQYRLVVTASGGTDYQTFSIAVYFNVTKATNEWVAPAGSDAKFIYPNIDSFTYKDVDSIVFTAGATKYGTAEIIRYRIVSANDVSKVIKGDDWFDYDNPLDFFKDIPAGSYILQVWVLEGATFNEMYSSSMPYPKLFYVNKAANSWKPDSVSYSISQYYQQLQGISDIDVLFATKPEAMEGTLVFQVLNTDYESVTTKYTYDNLLGGLKGLNAGEYILRVTLDDASLTNYGNLTADISLSIKRYTTVLNLPEKLEGQWQRDVNGNQATSLKDPDNAITAVYGIVENGSLKTIIDKATVITYTLEKKSYDSWNALVNSDEVKKLNAGSYQVVISVNPTGENKNVYSAVSATIQLDIKQGTNSWRNGWDIAESFEYTSGGSAGKSWTYGSSITWVRAIPQYGTTVYVEIKRAGASEALSYITINYSATDGLEKVIASVGSDLSKLDEGNYVITVTAPADTNWAELRVPTDFSVGKAGNDWVIPPHIKDATNNKWTYSPMGSAATPEATAQHGTVVYTYYNRGDMDHPLTGKPLNAGLYTVKFSVEGEENNYKTLSATIDFEIEKATDPSFIVSSGTTGWTWSSFNRLENLFTGIPNTRGNVSFTIIYDGAIVEVYDEEKGEYVPLDRIELVNADGKHTYDPDKDIYVPVYYERLINKLDAHNDYVLRINVGSVPNYNEFHSDSFFNIGIATNGWETLPGIVSWSLNTWKEANNMPEAVSIYGNPVITIRGVADDDIYFSGIYNKATQEYEIIVNKLASAPAGWYTMTTVVEGVEGQYTELKPAPLRFQVFVIGSAEEKNSWITDASISDWTATTELGEISMPVATPLRGKPYFLFYTVEGWLTQTPLGADDDVFVIEAGEDYFQDFYIPRAPGQYIMQAWAARYDSNGKEIDRIYSQTVPFEIFERDNYWENEPRIADVLYLGEKANWAQPTASAQEAGSVITFTYKDAETGASLGSEIPTKVGKYILTATATAKYCKTIYCDVVFSVEYSSNGWISAPTIEGWSAEYDGNNPFAEAVFGSDKIVYTYATQDKPDEILPDKPTEEGDYIMYANIYCEDEGYENIKAEFKFTVDPAYDIDLLIVDIVLGTVGCMLTVGVMYLAIKKRRHL